MVIQNSVIFVFIISANFEERMKAPMRLFLFAIKTTPDFLQLCFINI